LFIGLAASIGCSTIASSVHSASISFSALISEDDEEDWNELLEARKVIGWLTKEEVNEIMKECHLVNMKNVLVEEIIRNRNLMGDYSVVLMEKMTNYPKNVTELKNRILNLKKIPKEYKEIALDYINFPCCTNAGNGKITGLKLHPDLKKKIRENDLPDGFDMGIDKDGYFIHTHRARSKSYETPDKISVKDIKFIDSTG